MTIQAEIDEYLRTGHADLGGAAWPGNTIADQAPRAKRDRTDALVAEVQRRAASCTITHDISHIDTVALTRSKVEPMVRGLFPVAEQDLVLSVLERSVVFITAETLAPVLLAARWPRTAWKLANLYLASIGADLLADDAPDIVGMSEETTCYVSPAYFAEEDPFADFVVHEAAHIFHNCKRTMIGLPEKRRQEWLLPIAFRQRETFAYACEAYSRILARGGNLLEGRSLAEEYGARFIPADDRVDAEELSDIVTEAAGARNGWKRILSRYRLQPGR